MTGVEEDGVFPPGADPALAEVDGILAVDGALGGIPIGQCLRRSVLTAEKSARCHLGQPEQSPFSVANVLKKEAGKPDTVIFKTEAQDLLILRVVMLTNPNLEN